MSRNSTHTSDLHHVVMKVLDELSERYFIHKRPTIKKSDNLEMGWGGRGGRKTTVNFTFITERPTRSEIEREVRSILQDVL
jgi:hypothetical protein